MVADQRRGKPPTQAPIEVEEKEVWKVGGQLAVQARAGATEVEGEAEEVEGEAEEESLEPMTRKEQQQAYKEAMEQQAHGERRCKRENTEEERRRISLEGAEAIKANSAAELRFRLEAGKRLTAEKGMREQKRANEPTTDQEHVQILVKPGDIRPTKQTTSKTLRALAIHVIEEGLAGPYAGLGPNGKSLKGIARTKGLVCKKVSCVKCIMSRSIG